MGTRLTAIPAPLIKLAIARRDGLDYFVLGGIYLPPGSSNGAARLYRVNADLSVASLTPAGMGASGKDDSLALHILPNGTLRVVISEADVSQSGATSTPTIYDLPNIFPVLFATVDATARQQIADLRQKLHQV
jgi:hypothetical protein